MEKKKKKWLSLFLAVILAFTGLPVSLMAAGNAKSQTQETTKILPSQTSGEINCFSYESFSGKSWTYNDDEAYIDLGSSNEKAEECFYRVTFKGNAIEVFANKSHNHGKVKYRVDDGAETLVDLYESSRTTPQSVYKAENLTEGEHTLGLNHTAQQVNSLVLGVCGDNGVQRAQDFFNGLHELGLTAVLFLNGFNNAFDISIHDVLAPSLIIYFYLATPGENTRILAIWKNHLKTSHLQMKV